MAPFDWVQMGAKVLQRQGLLIHVESSGLAMTNRLSLHP